MIALYILAVILLILILLLFIPVNAHLSYNDSFSVKIKFAGIKIFDSGGTKRKKSRKKLEKKSKKPKKPKKPKSENKSKIKEQGKDIFKFLEEKYGFAGAVSSLFGLCFNVLTHIKKFLGHINIKKIIFELTVSSDNAADTAIHYGQVCSAAYPVFSFLDSFSGIGFKQININSDFTGNKCELKFSLVLKLQIFYLLVAAVNIYSEYKKFTLKENYNERK